MKASSIKNQQPIKIMYLTGTLEVGGAEKHLVELVSRLDRRQFQPLVCCLNESGPLAKTLADRGIPIRIFGYKGLHFREIGDIIRVFGSMYRFIRSERPTIVHTYLFWANVIGGMIAKTAGTPIVITSRRSLGHFKDGKLYYQLLENLLNRWTTAVTVNSQGVQRDVLKREKIKPDKIHLIYNGVDTDIYRPTGNVSAIRKTLSIPPDALVVGCIANLIPYKGHADLMRAFQAILKKWPNARLLLVGRDDGIWNNLERLAQQLGISRSVIFTGPRTDVPDIMGAIDVFVLASHEEGFSNVILEAMAAGKPVVATNVGGNPEAVLHGETGLIIPPHQPEALAEAIDNLLGDDKLRNNMGYYGRERAVQLFSIERMVRQYKNLYFSLLSNL